MPHAIRLPPDVEHHCAVFMRVGKGQRRMRVASKPATVSGHLMTTFGAIFTYSRPCLSISSRSSVVTSADTGPDTILQISPIDKIGTPVELIRRFGSRAGFNVAVHELQEALYAVA